MKIQHCQCGQSEAVEERGPDPVVANHRTKYSFTSGFSLLFPHSVCTRMRVQCKPIHVCSPSTLVLFSLSLSASFSLLHKKGVTHACIYIYIYIYRQPGNISRPSVSPFPSQADCEFLMSDTSRPPSVASGAEKSPVEAMTPMNTDDELLHFRRYSRVFPSAPYAKHTPRLGCAVPTGPHGTASDMAKSASSSRGSAVKILALLCSKIGPETASIEKRKRSRTSEVEEEKPSLPAEGGAASSTSLCVSDDSGSDGTPQHQKASIYVRVQYDKALISTLPLEVMRVRHPQLLIDYLLSMSVWT